ncbi:MAG: nucleotide sugar dehydrogenase [Cyanobium sp.]
MKICIVGLGYVGLPAACVLAQAGHEVVGVEIRSDLVEGLNQGQIHIDEPGLHDLLQEARAHGRFRAQTAPEAAEAFILCVPTPFQDGYQPDLSYVEAAARSVLPVLKEGDLVVVESTIPVGATEKVAALIRTSRPELTQEVLHVAHCPERVLPGNAIREIIHNDRVVGGTTAEATERAARLYRSFSRGTVATTTASTAELAKLAENTFRDINIAYANELSMLCSECGVDTQELIRLANMHPRVNIHSPGAGVGGHCIPVDPWFIVSRFPREAALIRAAREVNIQKETWVVDQVLQAARRHGVQQVVMAGLTYKPDVDDFRESPALRIAEQVAARLSQPLIGVDPYAAKLQQERKVGFALQSEIPLKAGTLVAVLVRHRQFGAALSEIETVGGAVLMDFCHGSGQPQLMKAGKRELPA